MNALIIVLLGVAAVASADSPNQPSVYYVVPPTQIKAPLKEEGTYHVYLPDGRLQKVQYETSPVVENPAPVIVASENIILTKVEPNGELHVVDAQPDVAEPKPKAYVAKIKYSEIAPIQGPIYKFNEKPLSRVVRYAPRFQ